MRLRGEDRLMPTLSFDPFFPWQGEDSKAPVAMSLFDSDTKWLAATIFPSKSCEHPYASQRLAAKIELSGHKEAVLKSDNEPAGLKTKRHGEA